MPTASPLVLIVEDHLLIGLVMKDEVERMGLRTAFAASVEETHTLLPKETPKVALVDLTLREELDGLELARTLITRGVRVVICSSYDRRSLRDEPPGVQAYLRKPFAPEQLATAVQAALAD